MDFLRPLVLRNPKLIETAVELHQSGLVPPNTYIIDYDTVLDNAKIIKEISSKLDITCYFMTKQFGRNPEIINAIFQAGFDEAVAIDIEEARKLYSLGVKLGHVGHLVQVPKGDLNWLVNEVRPAFLTVFSIEKAKQISDIAKYNQKIFLRIIGKGDFFYPYQEGGFPEERLINTIRKISHLPRIEVAGVTSFPCFRFNILTKKEEPLPNSFTLIRVAEKLKKSGFDEIAINMPGDSNSETLTLIKKLGGNQAEPGHAFTGTTPPNAFRRLPEKPACLYITEISHIFERKAYAIGGGTFFIDKVIEIMDPFYHGFYAHALVGSSPDNIFQEEYLYSPPSHGYIDYYIPLYYKKRAPKVGDSVIMCFRPQIFVSRAKVAVIKGIGKRGGYEILGLFDQLGNRLKWKVK